MTAAIAHAPNSCATWPSKEVLSGRESKVSSTEKQAGVVVHFVLGRCLSRELLLDLIDKKIAWLGDGWKEEHMDAALCLWGRGVSPLGPPGTSVRTRQQALGLTGRREQRAKLREILVTRSDEIVKAAPAFVHYAGGSLALSARRLQEGLTGVGEFKAGDVILDLTEPLWGMWTNSSGMAKQLERPSDGNRELHWYSGNGSRTALNRRSCREPEKIGNSDAAWDDELLESTKVMQKHMRHLRFGKLKRPWCVAFQEYGYCEYEGFLTRTKRVRPDWKNTSASLQRGGGHALHASGHARLWAQGGRNCDFSNCEL